MALMAPVIGGIILCYRGKYLWGAFITLLFTGLHVGWNHQQISYYLLITIVTLAVVYAVYAVKEHTLKKYFIASGILLVAATLAIAPAIGPLLATADYTKETMRGGNVLQNNAQGEKQASSGLDIDYAYQWSYGRGETMTLLIPNFYGSSSHHDIGNESESYRVLAHTGQAAQFCKHAPTYCGNQPFTSGPVYVGAIVCFLFVLGLFVVKGKEKWWLLIATIIAVVMAWGKNFMAVNELLFHCLPLYNKFRAPSMSLVVAELTMATLAILALKTVLDAKDKKQFLKPIYTSAAITGGLCLIFALFGSSLMNFSAAADANYKNFPELVAALIADRKSMLVSDSWRSLLFIAAGAATLWWGVNKKTKPVIVITIIGGLIFADLWSVDKRFINYDSFVPKKKAKEITATPADQLILQDTDPNFRVLNLTKSTFNESETSFFHKSIGGYSPAKLRRYQDIIDYHLSQRINLHVINMLNTKYVIVNSEQGPQVQLNEQALGNAWLVKDIQWVDSPDQEIVALNDFTPQLTAIVDTVWKSKLPQWETLVVNPDNDSINRNDYIKLTDYANPGNLFYESYVAQPKLAVFSEVFYKTWHAYVDEQEVPIIRANYILRAVAIPEGKHKIELKCIDDVYYTGAKLSRVASYTVGIILAALLALLLWNEWKKKNNIRSQTTDNVTKK
jgi:hypothetical protein